MKLIELLEAHDILICCNAVNWHVDSGAAAIFDAATDEMIDWAEGIIKNPLPEALTAFLKNSNGLFFGKLTFFGIAPSLFNRNALNRIQLEPQCVTLANTKWRNKFPSDPLSTMFGVIQGWEENIGLFMMPNGDVYQVCSGNTEGPSNIESILKQIIKMPNLPLEPSR